MKKERLDNLSDGIFAIIMTVLVFRLQIPNLPSSATSGQLLDALIHLYPEFIGYIVSFALLYTYWRGHNYTISVYAKNIDSKLALYNGIFFFFVGLIPFSAHLIGRFSHTPLAIIFYGINTIAITLTLHWMRNYVFRSETIQNPEYTQAEIRHGRIRSVVPGVCAFVAMCFSFVSPLFSLFLFTVAIVFNLVPGSTHLIDRLMYPDIARRERKNAGREFD